MGWRATWYNKQLYVSIEGLPAGLDQEQQEEQLQWAHWPWCPARIEGVPCRHAI